MKLLVREYIYWVNINADINNVIKSCSTCLEFQATQLKDKPILHDIPDKLWKTVDADICMLNNKTYFCIVDYHSKFPVMKLMDGLSVDSVIKTCIIIFAEYTLSNKIMSDAGTNFVSEKFQESRRHLDIN